MTLGNVTAETNSMLPQTSMELAQVVIDASQNQGAKLVTIAESGGESNGRAVSHLKITAASSEDCDDCMMFCALGGVALLDKTAKVAAVVTAILLIAGGIMYDVGDDGSQLKSSGEKMMISGGVIGGAAILVALAVAARFCCSS